MIESELIKGRVYEYNSPSHGKWIDVVYEGKIKKSIYVFYLKDCAINIIELRELSNIRKKN